jgi:hypothetical protein
MQLWPAVLASPALESSIKQCVIFTPTETALHKRSLFAWVLLAMVLATVPAGAQQKLAASSTAAAKATLWKDPGDIRAKDLFNGPGGDKHRPELPLKFLKEDKNGHNSKFDAEDANGTKWKVKLGIEAQPEVAASRLLWAIGYFANDNYFLRDVPVEGLPAHLKRGEGHVASPGHLDYARLQRHPAGEKKEANWDWQHNQFVGTREFNGLRVMMALINNWDLKTENNAIMTGKDGNREYMVTDVGTAFGAAGNTFTESASKNNLKAYRHSRFIAKVTPEYVDFNLPQRPPLLHLLDLPHFVHQMRMKWVGSHIPKSDAKWVGSLLARLSPQQLQDAFRAAGYSPEEIAGFTQALQSRIAELNKL